MLEAADDFETLHEPQCNIVAFRYLPRELRDAPRRSKSTRSNCGCAAP